MTRAQYNAFYWLIWAVSNLMTAAILNNWVIGVIGAIFLVFHAIDATEASKEFRIAETERTEREAKNG